jgi:SAM-dependent methyltransferase
VALRRAREYAAAAVRLASAAVMFGRRWVGRLYDNARMLRDQRLPAWRTHSTESADDVFARAVDRNFVVRLAVEVAATLGLVDHILAGATRLDALASGCDADPGALLRLLRLLQEAGLVRLHEDDGIVEVTAAGRRLASSDPLAWRVRLDQGGMGRRMDDAVFHGLLSSIRSGSSSYEEVHGRAFWEDMQALGLSGSFQAHMVPHVVDIAPAVAALPEVVAARSIVDICGGDGALLEAVLAANPHVRGSLLELPEVAAAARQRFAASALRDRVAVIEGDVFRTPVERHDLGLLCWVLHDWSDADAHRILGAAAAALAPGGRLVVIERPRTRSLEVLEADLRMLVFFGGRERSEQEWMKLFAEAGLALVYETDLGIGPFVAYCLERSTARDGTPAPDSAPQN